MKRSGMQGSRGAVVTTEFGATTSPDSASFPPGYRSDFEGGFLNGRDLVLVNVWSEQAVIIMDFTGVG